MAVAETTRVLILDEFALELHAELVKPFKRLVDVFYGKHDAEAGISVAAQLRIK